MAQTEAGRKHLTLPRPDYTRLPEPIRSRMAHVLRELATRDESEGRLRLAGRRRADAERIDAQLSQHRGHNRADVDHAVYLVPAVDLSHDAPMQVGAL